MRLFLIKYWICLLHLQINWYNLKSVSVFEIFFCAVTAWEIVKVDCCSLTFYMFPLTNFLFLIILCHNLQKLVDYQYSNRRDQLTWQLLLKWSWHAFCHWNSPIASTLISINISLQIIMQHYTWKVIIHASS